MKTAELLTEASLALREKVRDKLIIELDNMALEYRRGIAELSGNDIDDTPVPWAVVTSENHPMLYRYDCYISIIRDSNISDTMWTECTDEIRDYVLEKFDNTVLPVKVSVKPRTLARLFIIIE